MYPDTEEEYDRMNSWKTTVDTSIEADARRLRWLLDGNGYFLEEQGICGSPPCDDKEQNAARVLIDDAIKWRTYDKLY